jgi:hypothetical protein
MGAPYGADALLMELALEPSADSLLDDESEE